MILCLCSCPFQYVVAAVLFSAGVTLSSTAEAQCYVAKHTNEQTIANCTALIQSGCRLLFSLATCHTDYVGALSLPSSRASGWPTISAATLALSAPLSNEGTKS